MSDLIYGDFTIKDAPIAVSDDRATLTDGDGAITVVLGSSGNHTLVVRARRPGSAIAVTKIEQDVFSLNDPDSIVNRRLFRVVNASPVVHQGVQSWFAGLPLWLDSRSIELSQVALGIRSGDENPSGSEIDEALQLGSVRFRVGEEIYQCRAHDYSDPALGFTKTLSKDNPQSWLVRYALAPEFGNALIIPSKERELFLSFPADLPVGSDVPVTPSGEVTIRYSLSFLSSRYRFVPEVADNLLVREHEPWVRFDAPLVDARILDVGLQGKCVNRSLLRNVEGQAPSIEPADRIEELSRYLQTRRSQINRAFEGLKSSGSGGAKQQIAQLKAGPFDTTEIDYAVRPIEGDIEILNDDETSAACIDGRLLAGQHRIKFSGEIQLLRLPDRSNRGARLFGSDIRLRQRDLDSSGGGDGVGYIVAEALSASKTSISLGTPLVRDLVEPNHSPCLSYGDVSLIVQGNEGAPPASVVSRHHPDETRADDVRIRFTRLQKTPLKGDPDPRQDGSRALPITDARTEGYVPREGQTGYVELNFSTTGELKESSALALNGDIAAGFKIEAGRRGSNQPENVILDFHEGTTLTRKPVSNVNPVELIRLAESGDSYDANIYEDIDVTFEFPQVPPPGEVIGSLHAEDYIPKVRWLEDGAKKRNSELRRFWKVGTGDFTEFANNNPNPIEAGYGWALQLNGLSSEFTRRFPTQILVENVRNLPGQAKAAAMIACDPGGGRGVKINDPAAGSCIRVEDWWDHILPEPNSGDASAVNSPLDPNWCGIVFANGRVGAPPGIPESLETILESLPAKLSWFDGQGATSVVGYGINVEQPSNAEDALTLRRDGEEWKTAWIPAQDALTNPNAADYQLVLAQAQILISRSKLEVLRLRVLWNIPFFTRKIEGGERPNWVDITGRWEKQETGRESLVLRASLPEVGIELDWKDFKRVQVDQVAISYSGPRGGRKWAVSLEKAALIFDPRAADSIVSQWFDGRLKELDIEGLSFDFDDPLGTWVSDFLTVKLAKNLELFPRGFDFRIKGFRLGRPDQSGGTTPRSFGFIGEIPFSIPYLDFSSATTLETAIDFLWDPQRRLGISFDLLGVNELSFKLFNFVRITVDQLAWNQGNTTEPTRLQGRTTVEWNWSEGNSGETVTGFFVYGDVSGGASTQSREKYWLVGVGVNGSPPEDGGRDQTMNLGFLEASELVIVAGHKITQSGLRRAILALDDSALKDKLTGENLDQWRYSPESDWFAGMHFENLQIPGLGSVFEGRRTTIFMSDEGVFRFATSLTIAEVPFTNLMIAIDWRRRRISGDLALPAMDFGSFAFDLGSIGAAFGPGLLEINWGFPPRPDNWRRAVKVKWRPPPWPIPINSLQGGIMFRAEIDSENLTPIRSGSRFTIGVALRAGYEDMLGSDSGAFGAYLAGSIHLGAILVSEIQLTRPIYFQQTGIVTLSIAGRGGVVVFGIRWNVIEVWAEAAVGMTVTVFPEQRRMTAGYLASVSAGFRVCLTPCTCIGGSVTYKYGMDAEGQNTSYPRNSGVRLREAYETAAAASSETLFHTSRPELALYDGLLAFYTAQNDTP